ncbi:unnamed protein product [Strongylus vulgaris]|uniref:Uncharacterized protein n=1 Tax=Strongylus vulgaris TaxID=40348 RepID=A0A3P7IZX2_STRVU|nr:unnamed protein product [Strongylus vulgaris]
MEQSKIDDRNDQNEMQDEIGDCVLQHNDGLKMTEPFLSDNLIDEKPVATLDVSAVVDKPFSCTSSNCSRHECFTSVAESDVKDASYGPHYPKELKGETAKDVTATPSVERMEETHTKMFVLLILFTVFKVSGLTTDKFYGASDLRKADEGLGSKSPRICEVGKTTMPLTMPAKKRKADSDLAADDEETSIVFKKSSKQLGKAKQMRRSADIVSTRNSPSLSSSSDMHDTQTPANSPVVVHVACARIVKPIEEKSPS